jgi:hypothetical protein
MYEPIHQTCGRGMTVLVRTAQDPMSLVPAVRRIVRELDPDQPFLRTRTMNQVLDEDTSTARFCTVLFLVLGGVALLAINADRTASHDLKVPVRSDRYTLTARDLLDTAVQLNGSELKAGARDALPRVSGKRVQAGQVKLAPASITFLAIAKAGNASCR